MHVEISLDVLRHLRSSSFLIFVRQSAACLRQCSARRQLPDVRASLFLNTLIQFGKLRLRHASSFQIRCMRSFQPVSCMLLQLSAALALEAEITKRPFPLRRSTHISSIDL